MMLEMTRRRLLQVGGSAFSAAILSKPSSTWAASEPLPIMSYGGRWEDIFRNSVLPRFASLGYQGILDVGSGGKWASTLRAASKDKPPYSYVMTNEVVGEILRSEGYFQPWNFSAIPNAQAVNPLAKVANGSALTVMFAPIGIAYRKDMVSKPPTRWSDLWTNPELKGQIGLYSMQNTGGYMFLLLISKIFGKGPFDFDAGFKKIQELGSFLQSERGASLSMYMSRGEIVASIQDMAETLNMRRSGIPVEFVIPEEGIVGFDQTFSQVKNGASPDAATAFLNLILDKDIQEVAAREFSYLPVRSDVKLPQDMLDLGLSSSSLDKLVQFDWIEATKYRADVGERWNRLTSK